MHENIKDLIKNLKRIEPSQTKQIDKFFQCVRKASKQSKYSYLYKLLPKYLHRGLKYIHDLFQRDWLSITTDEILDECGITGNLRDFLTVHFGYIGTIPKESSFG